jgi:putative endonuclease
MERIFYVYILTNKPGGFFYVGITSNLIRRINQHKNDATEGFTKKYQLHKLVYYETHKTAYSAITREKQLKKWKRNWKIRLIKTENSGWRDLADDF